DDDRPLPAHERQVRHDLLERHARFGPIEGLKMVLRADVEFPPDLILLGQEFQTLLHLRQIQPRPVCYQHDLEERQFPERPHVHDRLDRLHEIGTEGRLAVAAQRHMPQHEQFPRQARIKRARVQLARLNQCQCPEQLGGRHVHIQPLFLGGQPAVHLAVDAVEIAALVRVEVHSHRQSARARRDSHVHKPIVEKITRITERRLGGVAPRPPVRGGRSWFWRDGLPRLARQGSGSRQGQIRPRSRVHGHLSSRRAAFKSSSAARPADGGPAWSASDPPHLPRSGSRVLADSDWTMPCFVENLILIASLLFFTLVLIMQFSLHRPCHSVHISCGREWLFLLPLRGFPCAQNCFRISHCLLGWSRLDSVMATNPIRGRRPTWVKWSIRIGVALFLYTIIGFFVLPAIIKSQLLKRLPPIVLRPVSIEQVRVNPYALSLTLRGFAIKETNGDNFISFDELYVNFQLSSIFRRKFTFAEISVKKPLAQITYLPEGVFNFANILTNLPPSPPGPPKPPPPLLVFQLSITNGAVAFVDLTRKTPFRTQFTPIDVDLTNLTTVRDKNSPYSIVARTGEGETFAWGGNVSINPLRSAGTFRLGGLALSKYAPYEQDYARFQIAGGKVDVAADYRYDSVVNALDGEVSNAVVHLDKFELKDGDTGETVLSIPSLSVEDASAAVLAHNARVGKIKSTGGFVLARQNHDGSINLLSQLILPTNHPPAAAAGTNAPSPLAAPWTARIDEIAFDNYSLKVEDHKPTTPASIDIDQLAFDIKNVSNVSNAPVSASLNLRLQQTGTVAVEGTATLLPPSADLNLTVSNIDLRVAQPYVHDQVKLIISSGGVNVHGRARYAAPEPGAPLASFTGDFALNNFLTTDDVLFKDFLKWNTLNVDGIKLAVLPN